jgi:hypothetical protein
MTDEPKVIRVSGSGRLLSYDDLYRALETLDHPPTERSTTMTWRGIKKALAPSIVATAALFISWGATGTFDRVEVGIIAAAAITALATYAVPNIAAGAGKLSSLLKALVAPALAIVTVGANWVETGLFNERDLGIAVGALIAAGLTYTVRNEATGTAITVQRT